MPDPLLEAAIVQFGEHGLAAASTRAIAAAAGTAMSTITYRHGGKDGLYLAAAGHIAEVIGARMATVLNAHPDDPVARAVAIVQRLASLMLADDSLAWSQFIVREQMAPTAAFERLWSGAMRGNIDALAACVTEATGRSDLKAARLTALTLIGQALIFRSGRAAVARVLDREALEADDHRDILDRIAANVRAILTLPEAP